MQFLFRAWGEQRQMAVTPWKPGDAAQLAQGWRGRVGLCIDSLSQASPFLNPGSHRRA